MWRWGLISFFMGDAPPEFVAAGGLSGTSASADLVNADVGSFAPVETELLSLRAVVVAADSLGLLPEEPLEPPATARLVGRRVGGRFGDFLLLLRGELVGGVPGLFAAAADDDDDEGEKVDTTLLVVCARATRWRLAAAWPDILEELGGGVDGFLGVLGGDPSASSSSSGAALKPEAVRVLVARVVAGFVGLGRADAIAARSVPIGVFFFFRFNASTLFVRRFSSRAAADDDDEEEEEELVCCCSRGAADCRVAASSSYSVSAWWSSSPRLAADRGVRRRLRGVKLFTMPLNHRGVVVRDRRGVAVAAAVLLLAGVAATSVVAEAEALRGAEWSMDADGVVGRCG
jgi:hypothetical protein